MLVGSASIMALSNQAIAKEGKMEKCYGIVKAGKNDCADSKQMHSCAGEAKVNGGKSEWILLPEGLCDRIVGGNLKAS